MSAATLLEVADAHMKRAAYIREHCKPSARKSFGSFKPIIVSPGFPSDRTEVVGTRAETRYSVWIDGKPDVKTAFTHYERGRTFNERGEAIDYARAVIERRVQDAFAKAESIRARIGGDI